MDLFHSFFKKALFSEYGSVSLHSLLELCSDLGNRVFSVSISDFVKFSNREFTSVIGEWLLGLARGEHLLSGYGSSPSKDNKIKQRVGTKSISAMDRCTSGFSAR